ncbi:UxaA family hydrolase [Salinisphaera sp. T31B1]|uniref:UxaA family hydrolase n=1 Tax=Salinisphaera sp. T31B1 TaxID=727963 RepID=UPI00333EA532
MAVVIAPVSAGTLCEITTPSGKQSVRAAGDIAFGHKMSVRAIGVGETVIKYGHPIGRAAAAIECGAHVHVHNLQGGVSA